MSSWVALTFLVLAFPRRRRVGLDAGQVQAHSLACAHRRAGLTIMPGSGIKTKKKEKQPRARRCRRAPSSASGPPMDAARTAEVRDLTSSSARAAAHGRRLASTSHRRGEPCCGGESEAAVVTSLAIIGLFRQFGASRRQVLFDGQTCFAEEAQCPPRGGPSEISRALTARTPFTVGPQSHGPRRTRNHRARAGNGVESCVWCISPTDQEHRSYPSRERRLPAVLIPWPLLAAGAAERRRATTRSTHDHAQILDLLRAIPNDRHRDLFITTTWVSRAVCDSVADYSGEVTSGSLEGSGAPATPKRACSPASRKRPSQALVAIEGRRALSRRPGSAWSRSLMPRCTDITPHRCSRHGH